MLRLTALETVRYPVPSVFDRTLTLCRSRWPHDSAINYQLFGANHLRWRPLAVPRRVDHLPAIHLSFCADRDDEE
jgi:hypothetical protein